MPAPTIETPRLLLRPWGPSDNDSWAALTADARVAEFLGPTKERNEALAQAQRLATRLDEDGYGWWVIEIKQGSAFAGVIVLQEVPFDEHFTPTLEIGWHLVPEYWKNGYATEGGRAALEFAFTTLDRREVVAITSQLNLRSQRVMQRIGMIRDLNGDFDHPLVPTCSPLRRHVLYRALR